MKIIVTGGAGFIGSHVTDRMIQLGHEVIVIDNLSSGKTENINPKATFIELDIGDPALSEVFKKYQPEILLHFAAQMDVRRSVADPQFDCKVNGLGLLNLLELGKNNGLRKVLFASTCGIYGEQKYFPADEDHPLCPGSPYGITKLMSEKYLHFYYKTYGIHYVALRFANVYGPRQNHHGDAGVIAIFCNQLLSNQVVTIYGDGKQTRDYVYVHDVVDALVKALQSPITHAVFNVGTGMETDVNKLYQILSEAMKKSIVPQYAMARSGEQLRSVISSAKIQQELGWKSQVSLQDGLKLTLDFFKSKSK